jgi:carboxymethylenebutenolidase
MQISEDSLLLDTPTGKMRAVVHRPTQAGSYPGVLFYSEIFQLTAPILRSAAMMAGHGFIVVSPEIYHDNLPAGTVLKYDDNDKEVGNRLKAETSMESFDQGAQAVLSFMEKDPRCNGKLASMGFCLGGHLAFRAALNPKIKASACFYATDIHSGKLGLNQPCDTFERMGEIQAEMLMIWGRQDPHIPNEGLLKIYEKMTREQLHFTWHEFNGAHAFMRDEGDRYNPSLAHQCYGLVVDMFNRVLK